MTRRTIYTGASFAGFLLGVALLFTAAYAQNNPKEDARDLATSLLPDIQAGAEAPPDADSVPGFVTDDPAETGYYASPASIDADAAAAELHTMPIDWTSVMARARRAS